MSSETQPAAPRSTEHMAQNLPLVTVGVASYNNAAYLRETLESIRLQTYPNVELLVVDDASTDDSVAVVEAWLAEHPEVNGRLIRHPTNRGICPSCNDLLNNATGEYFSVVGSDDVYLPDKLEHQVKLLHNAGPEFAVLTSSIEFMDGEGNKLPKPDDFAIPHPPEVFIPLLKGCFIGAVGVLIRRSCFATVGQYDEQLPFEDWDMWLRMSRQYKFLYSPKVSARYRRHRNSFFETRKRQAEEGALLLLNKHRGVSAEADAIIIAQTRLRAEWLYQIGSPQAAHWLGIRWRDSRDLRSLALYTLAKMGVSGEQVVKFQRRLGR